MNFTVHIIWADSEEYLLSLLDQLEGIEKVSLFNVLARFEKEEGSEKEIHPPRKKVKMCNRLEHLIKSFSEGILNV